MNNPEKPSPHPLRKALLITEFSALAVLLISMGWFSSQTDTGHSINPAWLLIPALASLGVFISFIGLMYLRWVVAVSAANQFRHKIVFFLLALTLLGVWVYGIASTWLSLNAA
ncbi:MULTISPECIES: hypothetical protein [Marinobacter]|uniref:Uncharacterized protein n=1 Tax=Marinobacter xiaoshiensis TaxID=3073652 RepID=A0ABU2HDK6_9GAMM|nr:MULTISPECIES: hypothetical protein [unclassified Marinobacter]MBK1873952.1 hypothetical protein [Marinobacter sp. 1-3A]MBK1887930.1 hypothetical protein [Marinobacter sp. DY40_1A1]MDS1308641.1 hypothetical protein [Marinobacter sp. F60267]